MSVFRLEAVQSEFLSVAIEQAASALADLGSSDVFTS